MAKGLTLLCSLASNVQNLYWYKGEDVLISAAFSGTQSISGWTLSFTIRDEYGGSILIQKTIGSGISVTSAANGTFTITITSANTNIDYNTYLGNFPYDVSRTDSGNEQVLATGLCFISPAATIQ